jgi:predicted nucleotidyltransferase
MSTTPGVGTAMTQAVPAAAASIDIADIPGIPEAAQRQLLQALLLQPEIQAVWLFGSRAMGRQHSGSDIDLCLDAPGLSHSDRLSLMAVVDDLLLPWQVDLVLRHEMPNDLAAHMQRVGRCLWQRP